jgi:GAF domain-containing protein
VRKDGQIIWVEQRNVLIRDQNGTLVAVQSIARDITEAKNRERDLEALYQSGVSLRQVSNPKAVARKVIELLEQHMEWHHAAVWIRREHSENIEQLAYSQVYSTEDTLRREKAKSRALVHNIHTGLAGWVVGHGETVRKGDVASDPRYAKINESVRSGLYVPIKMGQETIGCISAESMRPDAFSAHDERLLTTVAAQAAIALENARLYQASRQAAMRRDVLYRASQEIAQASQDIEKVYETVCRTAKKLMPAEVFTISRVTPGQSEIQGVYLVDKGKRLPPLSVPFGEGLAGKVIADGKPIIISDFLAQTEIKTIKIGGSKARARSVLAVPMRVGNEIMGAISVQSYQPGVYSDDDAVLLGMLASYTGVTIQNADLFEQTRFRAAQLVRINDLGRAMAETFDLIEIYTRLARIALDLIPGSATLYISLFNPLTREIRAAYSVHDGETLDVSALPTVPLSPPGEGTQSQAIHTGKPVIIDDLGKVYQKGKLKVTRIGTEGPSTQSGIFVPMVAHGTVIGVLQLQSYARAHYSPADAELLSLVANTAAVSIENARLYDKTRRNAEQLSQLNALGRELATTISPASIYHTTHAYVRQFLDCPDLGIFLLDSIEQDLRPVFLIVNGQEIDVTAPFPMHQERSQAQVIQSGRTKAVATAFPVILNDLSLEPGMSTRGEDQPHPQSVIYTPMVVDGVVVGILEVHSYRRDAYSEEDADLLSTIANPIGLSIKNARLFTQIERQVTQLSALRTIDNAISSNTDLNTTLSIILEQVKTELGVDAVDILLFKPETMTLEHVANRGFHTDAIYNISLRLGEGIAGKTALERKPLVIEDLVNVNIDNLTHYDGLLSAEQFVAYANAPLVSKGQLKGVLEVFQRTFLNVDSDWLTFLEMMGNEAAIAIDNADLFNELQRSNLDLTIAYDATIEGWSQTLELRESPSASRGRLVTDMTLRLARIMNIQGLELIHIRRGSLLHDVGKMGVPDHILKKPGPLNEAEWQIVRQHPVLAHSLLSHISYLRPALDIPYCHHERWDGTGYPRKLRGEQIPLSARVFAVVDVYNALVSDRSYRKALPQAEAFKYLREQAGGQFDPAVVEMFLKMMEADEMPD